MVRPAQTAREKSDLSAGLSRIKNYGSPRFDGVKADALAIHRDVIGQNARTIYQKIYVFLRYN